MTAAFLVMAMYLFLVERKKFEKIGFMNPASSEETVKLNCKSKTGAERRSQAQVVESKHND